MSVASGVVTEGQIREPVVKSTDMNEDMQQDAILIANDALNKFKVEKVSKFPTFAVNVQFVKAEQLFQHRQSF
ncbi:unnamed protein product [Enterobius vermicularis]|uniref:Dynein light chain n=1 Tax=Enterobius vermicularis TaxID=51028 RepID=A0A0N4VN53_ENTVE|nr:unnamed protein product [Enterobius vermicularis]